MAWKFEVGKKVICKSAGPKGWYDYHQMKWVHGPIQGGVYMVTRVELRPTPWGKEIVGIWLAEFPNRNGYDSSNFEPVIDTDISIFEAMLNTAPKEVREDA